MKEYLNENLSLTLKLAAIKAETVDGFIGVIMLNGLGHEYDSMIMAMESSFTKISSDYVRSVLIQQDTKHRTEDDPQDTALIANWKGKNSFIPTCFVCYKKGHNS
jgi:hypothetical protein